MNAFPSIVLLPQAEVVKHDAIGAASRAANCARVQPLRATYKMALTTSRRGYLAGRPPGFGSGTQGPILRHWASDRSVG